MHILIIVMCIVMLSASAKRMNEIVIIYINHRKWMKSFIN
jgi:hypothetical protein